MLKKDVEQISERDGQPLRGRPPLAETLSDCPDQESAATAKRYREFALGYGCLFIAVEGLLKSSKIYR